MNVINSKPAAMATTISGTTESAALFLSNHRENSSANLFTEASSDLSITVKNGIATLSGSTESAADSNMAEYLVSRLTGVETVINLISHR